MKKSLLLFSVGVSFYGAMYFWNQTQTSTLTSSAVAVSSQNQTQSQAQASQIVPVEQRYPHLIQPGSTLVSELRHLDISHQDIYDVVEATKSLKDLGRLNAGTRFQIGYASNDNEVFSMLKIRLTPQESLLVERSPQGIWQAQIIKKKIDTRVVTFSGTVDSSLWESAVAAEMSPLLISELAEIFAWQVDFAREVHAGDQWRLSVEEETVQGEKIGWGSILSAEYKNGDQTYQAVLLRKDGEDLGYFAADGSSLKRVFLKSPIEYARISSRFNLKRFHPILNIIRPHKGVDYAAATGTPVRGVGDGIVEDMGRNSAAGNFIKVRHGSTYATAYKHLSRFAKGLRKGARVEQGQTIGYVGSTGLSSGPHLHFEFYVNGKYVDPLGQQFPAASPVPQDLLAEFYATKETYLAYLPRWENENSL